MTIQLPEQTVGVWFVTRSDGNLFVVASYTEGGVGELICHFRTHHRPGVEHTTDHFRVTLRNGDDTIPAAREAAQWLARKTDGRVWVLLCGAGGLETLVDQLKEFVPERLEASMG